MTIQELIAQDGLSTAIVNVNGTNWLTDTRVVIRTDLSEGCTGNVGEKLRVGFAKHAERLLHEAKSSRSKCPIYPSDNPLSIGSLNIRPFRKFRIKRLESFDIFIDEQLYLLFGPGYWYLLPSGFLGSIFANHPQGRVLFMRDYEGLTIGLVMALDTEIVKTFIEENNEQAT